MDGLQKSINPLGYLDENDRVPVSMFKENREKITKRMIDIINTNGIISSSSIKQNLQLYPVNIYKNYALMKSVLKYTTDLIKTKLFNKNYGIFLQGGKDLYRYDTDVTYIFRQESFFAYLFGINEPDCYGFIDLTQSDKLGESILFVPFVTDDMEVWQGKRNTLDFYKEKYGVDHVHYTTEIEKVLTERNMTDLFINKGVNWNSDRETELVVFDGIEKFNIIDDILYKELCECRVIKTEKELNLLRYVCKISSEAHIEVMKNAKNLTYERELESLFLYYINKNYGCRHISYTCVCCSGHNGAVLHYGHAGAPNDRKINDGEMLLLDMGAEYNNYASDITCSFPFNGKFTEQQKAIYNAVLDSQRTVERNVRAGVTWRELQIISQKVILEHLIKLGLVIQHDQSLDDLVIKYNIGNLFMPHGFGHLMGLDVHDVNGYLEFPENVVINNEMRLDQKKTKLSILREGMVITVEPGIYFIETLLLPAFDHEEKGKFLNKEEILKYMNFGGVRLEDDVVVLTNSCEVISNVPREIDEVEKIMV